MSALHVNNHAHPTPLSPVVGTPPTSFDFTTSALSHVLPVVTLKFRSVLHGKT